MINICNISDGYVNYKLTRDNKMQRTYSQDLRDKIWVNILNSNYRWILHPWKNKKNLVQDTLVNDNDI